MSGDFAGNVEFQKLVAGRDDIDLVELLLEFAEDAYSNVDRESCLVEIDRLGRQALKAVSNLKSGSTLRDRLLAVSHLLYEQEGFRGNNENYYDPRNSYLNEVLERRTGIPITLCIVYRAVASRAGIKLDGIGAPAHFVLGGGSKPHRLFVDAFSAGAVLDWNECRESLEARLGRPGSLAAGLHAASSLEIAARVLRNLKMLYATENQWAEALPVQQRLVMLLPEKLDEIRDLGLMHLRLGNPKAASQYFERYLSECSEADTVAVMPFVRNAQRMIAEMN
jgi:regulator of sirC expression with transglutaminase-like and TPR domain